jgi:hypothetical protein
MPLILPLGAMNRDIFHYLGYLPFDLLQNAALLWQSEQMRVSGSQSPVIRDGYNITAARLKDLGLLKRRFRKF